MFMLVLVFMLMLVFMLVLVLCNDKESNKTKKRVKVCQLTRPFVRAKMRNNYEYTAQRHTMMMAIVSTGSRLLLLLVRVRMFVAFGAGSIGTGLLLVMV